MSKHILQVGTAKIKTDSNDMVSLTDIWKAAQVSGYANNKHDPRQWKLKAGRETIDTVAQNLNVSSGDIYRTVQGKSGGSYAVIQIALAYAAYLDPQLEYQINTTFIRAKSGDVTLADEIVDRAKPEDQVKHLMRTAGKVQRNEFTKILKHHEVDGIGIGVCTNSLYTGLFNKCAAELRKLKNIPAKANVREHMTIQEIIQTAHAEMIAARNIDATRARGTRECAHVCEQAARKVASI